MLTCELVNQMCCEFFSESTPVGLFFVAISLRCDNMHHNNSMLVCFFTFFSCCFELESVCLVCIIHIETCCDIVVFFLKIDRNRRHFDNECNEKLLCTRQEKQSVTIRGKIKSSACRSTVCEIQHKNE